MTFHASYNTVLLSWISYISCTSFITAPCVVFASYSPLLARATRAVLHADSSVGFAGQGVLFPVQDKSSPAGAYLMDSSGLDRNGRSQRRMHRETERAFAASCAGYLTGRGCSSELCRFTTIAFSLEGPKAQVEDFAPSLSRSASAPVNHHTEHARPPSHSGRTRPLRLWGIPELPYSGHLLHYSFAQKPLVFDSPPACFFVPLHSV